MQGLLSNALALTGQPAPAPASAPAPKKKPDISDLMKNVLAAVVPELTNPDLPKILGLAGVQISGEGGIDGLEQKLAGLGDNKLKLALQKLKNRATHKVHWDAIANDENRLAFLKGNDKMRRVPLTYGGDGKVYLKDGTELKVGSTYSFGATKYTITNLANAKPGSKVPEFSKIIKATKEDGSSIKLDITVYNAFGKLKLVGQPAQKAAN